MNRSGAVIKRPSRWSISLLVLQFLAVTGTLRGAAITWGPATDIAGDTDVVNTGVLVYSYEWDALPSTVNGVSFTVAYAINGGSNVLAPSFDYDDAGYFASSSTPFSALSAAYKNILEGADWGYGPVQVTLAHLAIGHKYLVQVWVNDPRGQENSRSETITSPGGNTNTLHFSTGTLNNSGEPGQFTVGTFTADATNQTFTLMGDPVNDVTQMNALQVRDSVPTWSAIRPAGAGTVRLIFNGPSADHYTLLTTTNIFTPISDWTPLPNGTGTFGAINITNLDSVATNKTQFYRIRSP